MEEKPLVSILINNYNYGHFLSEAIDSAIEQTYKNIEVIVVDDGSTDNSKEIIASYGNKIVSIVKENGGQASAFNTGFATSKGEIICFLDADDLFLENKLKKVVSVFYENPDVSWCFHSYELMYQHKNVSNIENKAGSGIYDIRNDIKKGKLNGKLPISGFVTSVLCYRRTLLDEILPMPEDIRITSDDYLKYTAFALAPGYVLLENLARQRIHDNNAYTLRHDKQELQAKVIVKTAFFLKEKHPSLAKFTNNLFAVGLIIYQGIQIKDENTKIFIESYLRDLKIIEKIEIATRIYYYRIKNLIKCQS